ERPDGRGAGGAPVADRGLRAGGTRGAAATARQAGAAGTLRGGGQPPMAALRGGGPGRGPGPGGAVVPLRRAGPPAGRAGRARRRLSGAGHRSGEVPDSTRPSPCRVATTSSRSPGRTGVSGGGDQVGEVSAAAVCATTRTSPAWSIRPTGRPASFAP